MELTTVTSASLLAGLKDPENETIWRQYVDRYRPLIVSFLSGLGLTGDDAEDVAQTSLIAFSTGYLEGKYDPAKGRLRSWLFGIVHHKLRDHNRKRRDRELQVADTAQAAVAFGELEAESELEARWEAEWRDAVLQECLTHVRREVEESTWRAFELFTQEEWPAERVAQELCLTPNAVYGAKRRVLRRLREVQPLVEDVW